MTLRVAGATNVGGGCMGMCQERVPFVVNIQKQVQGGGNFVTAVSWPGFFN